MTSDAHNRKAFLGFLRELPARQLRTIDAHLRERFATVTWVALDYNLFPDDARPSGVPDIIFPIDIAEDNLTGRFLDDAYRLQLRMNAEPMADGRVFADHTRFRNTYNTSSSWLQRRAQFAVSRQHIIETVYQAIMRYEPDVVSVVGAGMDRMWTVDLAKRCIVKFTGDVPTPLSDLLPDALSEPYDARVASIATARRQRIDDRIAHERQLREDRLETRRKQIEAARKKAEKAAEVRRKIREKSLARAQQQAEQLAQEREDSRLAAQQDALKQAKNVAREKHESRIHRAEMARRKAREDAEARAAKRLELIEKTRQNAIQSADQRAERMTKEARKDAEARVARRHEEIELALKASIEEAKARAETQRQKARTDAEERFARRVERIEQVHQQTVEAAEERARNLKAVSDERSARPVPSEGPRLPNRSSGLSHLIGKFMIRLRPSEDVRPLTVLPSSTTRRGSGKSKTPTGPGSRDSRKPTFANPFVSLRKAAEMRSDGRRQEAARLARARQIEQRNRDIQRGKIESQIAERQAKQKVAIEKVRKERGDAAAAAFQKRLRDRDAHLYERLSRL